MDFPEALLRRRVEENFDEDSNDKETYDDAEQEKIIQDLKDEFHRTVKIQNSMLNLFTICGVGASLFFMFMQKAFLTYGPGLVICILLNILEKLRLNYKIPLAIAIISIIISYFNPESLEMKWRVGFNIGILFLCIFKISAIQFSKSMPEKLKHLESLKYPNPKA